MCLNISYLFFFGWMLFRVDYCASLRAEMSIFVFFSIGKAQSIQWMTNPERSIRLNQVICRFENWWMAVLSCLKSVSLSMSFCR